MRSFVFRARDRTLDLGPRTALMGVVNVTPDSFFAASRRLLADDAVEAALRLIEAGCDIVDIGGESTRPGSRPVAEVEELSRVVPVIEKLRSRTSALLSIDTRKASVAAKALGAGADIVNDVSALDDPAMAEAVAAAGAGLVLMHLKGTPESMQEKPTYDDVVGEVRDFLAARVERAETYGVRPDGIAVDPGIGFGKTLEHNLALLNRLDALTDLGKPIVVGPSRKSFIGALLGEPPENRIFGTAASVSASILRGAHIVRIHDVREMRDVATVTDAIRNER